MRKGNYVRELQGRLNFLVEPGCDVSRIAASINCLCSHLYCSFTEVQKPTKITGQQTEVHVLRIRENSRKRGQYSQGGSWLGQQSRTFSLPSHLTWPESSLE